MNHKEFANSLRGVFGFPVTPFHKDLSLDLKGLAKRVTGNEENWRQIAKDNSLNSPTDVAPFQSIWVANNLLKKTPANTTSNK